MARFRHNEYFLLIVFGIVAAFATQGASESRPERLYGSSSGSSVIVVYKKEHDKGHGGDRNRGDLRRGQRDSADRRDDDYRGSHDNGRKVDQEIRKEHGIEVYPTHSIDNHFQSRERDVIRDPLDEEDPRETKRFHRDHRSDRVDGRSILGTGGRIADDSKTLLGERGHAGDSRQGNGEFDVLPVGGGSHFRFVNSQLSQPTPRAPSLPSTPPGFLEARPTCARELDLCSHSHDYPSEKVQTIVDRYYNQMYDLYHAMYKIPPHEVQWVENYTHSFTEEKQHGEFVCTSETSHMRIGWAKNYKGRWMAVVNTERFPQTTRVEKCSHREKPCGYLPPCFKTACKQREMLFPLISVNPLDPSQKPQVDLFPVPSGCVCYVYDAGRSSHGLGDGRGSSGSRSKLPAFLRSD